MTITENILEELKLFVNAELRYAEDAKYAVTISDIINSRNRAFGAVEFTLKIIDSKRVRNIIRTWWNYDMLDQFNTLIAHAEYRAEWSEIKKLPFQNGFACFKDFVEQKAYYSE